MAKACAYSCQHCLWRHVGVGEFREKTSIIRQLLKWPGRQSSSIENGLGRPHFYHSRQDKLQNVTNTLPAKRFSPPELAVTWKKIYQT